MWAIFYRVQDAMLICRNYFRGAFMLDALSSVPLSLIIGGGGMSCTTGVNDELCDLGSGLGVSGESGSAVARLNKMLRLLRLSKLMRLMKVDRCSSVVILRCSSAAIQWRSSASLQQRIIAAAQQCSRAAVLRCSRAVITVAPPSPK